MMNETFLKQSIPQIIICCGSGGVGKTTTSVALGINGAMQGLKTLVLTIDPAKRLADSMGLAEINYEEQKIPATAFEEAGINVSGELFAMMLDTKTTFDQLVTKHASQKLKERIFKNRFYQHLSTTMAGSHEYMAMEKLLDIYNRKEYDLIVLDTPPSRRALDFLDSPKRLLDLLGHNLFWSLFKPYIKTGRFGLRILTKIATPFIKAMNQIIGSQVVKDISDFLSLQDESFFEGFRNRAKEINELFASKATLFVAISSPRQSSINEALFLVDKLNVNQMPFGGFIINRVHPVLGETESNDANNDADFLQTLPFRDKLIENYHLFHKQGLSDASVIETLKNRDGSQYPVITVPYFKEEVHSLSGVIQVRDCLFP